MKRILLIFIGLAVAMGLIASININISPNSMDYNRFNIGQLDPEVPEGQPILFSGTISNDIPGESLGEFALSLSFTWDGLELYSSVMDAKDQTFEMNSISITNRDILDSDGSIWFKEAKESLSLDHIFDIAPTFEDVILNTGLLPDGTFIITLEAIDYSNNNISLGSPATFTFNVTNSNAIFLNQPGNPQGRMIPDVSNNTVLYSWQTNLVGLNDFSIVIKEFEAKDELTSRNLDSAGRMFYEAEGLTSNSFAMFLPFTDGYYYAWKVSTGLVTESSSNNHELALESDYNVFRYVEDTSSEANQISVKIVELLKLLNNAEINALLEDGMIPTQQVVTDENWLSGKAAVEKLREFIRKPVTVSIEE